MHDHALGLAYVFIAANTAIAAGYVSVPFLVLPYLPITRTVLWFGIGFFFSAALATVWQVTAHPYASPAGVLIHGITALCVWSFLAAFSVRKSRQSGK